MQALHKKKMENGKKMIVVKRKRRLKIYLPYPDFLYNTHPEHPTTSSR